MRILLLAGLAALFGCQKGTTAPTPYERDLDRICHAEEQSGAAEQHEGARALAVAQWLGANIETQQGRELLASMNAPGVGPADKARILDEAAASAGIEHCPTARAWAP